MKYSRTYHDAHKPKFAFAADGQKPDNSKGKTAEMLYPGGKEKDQPNGYSKVQAWFEYNEEDGKYYRYQYGGPHIDESTGEQLAFDNVISSTATVRCAMKMIIWPLAATVTTA